MADVPVETRGLDPGPDKTFTLTVDGRNLPPIKVGNKQIKIIVKSGKSETTIYPIDTKDWGLKIELVRD